MELKKKPCENKMVDALRGGCIMIGIAKRVQKRGFMHERGGWTLIGIAKKLQK